MKRYILTLALIASAITGITAQRALTLDECRELALRNNSAVKNSELLNRVAAETRREAFTKYFPNISAGAAAFTTSNGLLRHDFKGQLPIPPIPGVTEGGMYDYDVELNLIKKGVVAGVSLLQPVFMGGEIHNANKLAEIGEAIADLQSRQSSDQVRLTVEQYFWQIAVLKAKQCTVADLSNMLEALDRQVAVAVDAGVVLPNDLLEVRLRRNEMTTDSIQLENGISTLSSLLSQYIGLGLDPIEIADSIDRNKCILLPDSLYLAPETALHSTVDFQLLDKGVKAADVTHRMAIGANLPKVAVGAGFTESNLARQWHGNASVFATLTIPVSEWWGGSHAIKRSKLNAQVARNNLNDNSELLMVRMNNEWNNLTTSCRKIEVALKSIDQARENLRLNTLYYKAGTVTITDLLKSQTLFRQSHDRYIEAVGQYYVDMTKYLIATGR